MDHQELLNDLHQRKIVVNEANSSNFLKLEPSEKVIYFGIDCTGDSLHLGHLFSLFQLIRFARADFKILLILGGATSKIGDPSDKLRERPQLAPQEITNNFQAIKKQISNLLLKKRENKTFPFQPLSIFFADNPSLLQSIYQILFLNKKNNSDLWTNYLNYIWPLEKEKKYFQILDNKKWLNKLSFIDFIDQVGKNITINYLLAKETIKQRVNSENGLSFSSFSYSLLQAYDFYYLYKNHNCHGQLGASDQWGNLTTGLKLINSYYPESKTFSFTWGLLLDKEGKKISKSATNQKTIWLDQQKTSFREAYDFLSNMSDEQADIFIKQFTFLSLEQIDKLNKLNNPKKLRIPQRILIELIFYLLYQEKGIAWLKEKIGNGN